MQPTGSEPERPAKRARAVGDDLAWVEAADDLLAWLEAEHRRQGTCGDLDHLEVRAHGLFTSRAAHARGSKLLSVPLACVLTCERAADSALGVALAAFAPDARPEHALWLFMAQARRRPDCAFGAFMRYLPAEAPDAASWPAAEREWLRDTILFPVLRGVDEELGALVELAARLAARHPELGLGGLTLDELRWARGHHRSRRFADALNPAPRLRAAPAAQGASHLCEHGLGVMIPLLDKTNHDPGAQVSWRLGAREVAFHCEQDVAHAAGEVLNNYGPKSNEMLLLDFGFALPDNAHDGVSLTLCVGAGAGVRRLGPFEVRRPSARWPTFPRRLWRALADPEGAGGEGAGDEAEDEDQPVAVGLDEVELLRAQLARRLELLAGSEQDDARDWTDCARRRFVALYRAGQREVLRAALGELEVMLEGGDGGDGEDSADDSAEEEE